MGGRIQLNPNTVQIRNTGMGDVTDEECATIPNIEVAHLALDAAWIEASATADAC